MSAVRIADRPVGEGHPCFIIAEAGVNHNGDLSTARTLIDGAVEAGADAVKFQTFKTEAIVTPQAGESQFAMLKRLELSREATQELFLYSKKKGILFLSTPFEEESADFLEELGVEAFKIPSGEVTNLPFLSHVAAKGRPIILSTGMSTLEEVVTAVKTLRTVHSAGLDLLHCVSNYPTDPEEANLRAMETLRRTFRVPVGFSDHTLGIEIALAAVALGACVIEKHFTLDHRLPGPDHRVSLELEEMRCLVQGIRKVEKSLGDGRKVPAFREMDTASVARKSLVAGKAIARGSLLTRDLVVIRRPGTGLPPAMWDLVLWKKAGQDIPEGTPFTLEMLE